MAGQNDEFSGVGERVRHARERQESLRGEHLSREKLGRLLSRSSRTIQRWEEGEYTPDDYQLRAISDITGFRFEWLKTGEAPKLREERAPDSESEGRIFREPLSAYASESAPAAEADVDVKNVPLLTVSSGPEKLVSVHLTIRVHRPPKDVSLDA